MNPASQDVQALSRARAGVLVAAFLASLLAVGLTPWCTRDRVGDAQVFADAAATLVQAHASRSPAHTVLVHPPWRDDVVSALAAGPLSSLGYEVTAAFAPRHGDAVRALWIVSDDSAPLPALFRGKLLHRGTLRGVSLFELSASAAPTPTGEVR